MQVPMITTHPGYQEPPFIYGQILARSLYVADSENRSDVDSIGQHLTRGAAVSITMMFLLIVVEMFLRPNFYNFLFVRALPVFLGEGLLFGLLEGVVIWSFGKIVGHRLGLVVRGVLGLAVLETAQLSQWLLLSFLYPQQQPPPDSTTVYWIIHLTFFVFGVLIGLVTGSRLQLWRALVRGTELRGERSSLLPGITGFLLRVIVTFFFMESVVALVSLFSINYQQRDLVSMLIAVGHFAASLVVVFTRLRFWQLLPLAVLVNVPVVALLTKLKPELWLERHVILAYLAVWLAFLITRSQVVKSAFAVVKNELRYYLID